MARQDAQHLHAFFFALWFDSVAEDDLVAGLMHALFEPEPAAFLGLLDRPAGKYACHFCDISLGVAAIDAQGVQLHQLAPIILVQAASLFVLSLERWPF